MNKKDILYYSNLNEIEWIGVKDDFQRIIPIDERTKVLKEVHEVISELNINVYLTGGSLLGAVREGDFILWDDDIDMDMLHEEFIEVMYRIKESFIKRSFVVRLKDSKNFPKMSLYKNGQKVAIGSLLKKGKWRIRPSYRYHNKFFIDKTINFKGMNFLCPHPPEEHLTWVYGNWKKVIKSDIESEYMNLNHFRKMPIIDRILRKIRYIFMR